MSTILIETGDHDLLEGNIGILGLRGARTSGMFGIHGFTKPSSANRSSGAHAVPNNFN